MRTTKKGKEEEGEKKEKKRKRPTLLLKIASIKVKRGILIIIISYFAQKMVIRQYGRDGS